MYPNSYTFSTPHRLEQEYRRGRQPDPQDDQEHHLSDRPRAQRGLLRIRAGCEADRKCRLDKHARDRVEEVRWRRDEHLSRALRRGRRAAAASAVAVAAALGAAAAPAA